MHHERTSSGWAALLPNALSWVMLGFVFLALPGLAQSIAGARLFTDAALATPGLIGSYVNRSIETDTTTADWRVTQVISGTRVDTNLSFTTGTWGSRAVPLNTAIGRWQDFVIPLRAPDSIAAGWRRTVSGSPRLDHISSVEFHADTIGQGLELWIDKVRFGPWQTCETCPVIAWGDNYFGQTDVPADLSNVVAIAAAGHCLTLTADGRVVGWGNDEFGQLEIPLELSNVAAIAAGNSSSLALRGDGSVAITVQPVSRPVCAGATVTLTVMALGTAPLSYQWQFSGTNLPGATNASLVLPRVQLSHAGSYSVIVRNALGERERE